MLPLSASRLPQGRYPMESRRLGLQNNMRRSGLWLRDAYATEAWLKYSNAFERSRPLDPQSSQR